MKNPIIRMSALLILVLALIVVCAACDGGSREDPTETEAGITDAPTEPDETEPAEVPTEAPTEEETTEEVTTLRELVWETYDPVLDNSTVDTSAIHNVNSTTWVATDGLDRVMPTNTEVGPVRMDKTVAMFYWTWHGSHGNSQTAFNNQQNLDRLFEAGLTEDDYWTMSTSQLRKYGVYTQTGPYHFWDEPIYGYYDGDDEWVIRKQAELLAAAGVDVVFFDNTNGTFTWMETALHVMKVFSEAREQGVAAPAVSFMFPFAAGSDTATQVRSLYKNIYEKNLYSEVWFYLDDKPMVMGYSGSLGNSGEDKEIKDFFTWRANRPGYLDTESGRNEWGWLSVAPQAYFHNKDGVIEQMTVGTAVNHDYVKHKISGMSKDNIIGRTWTTRGYDSRENALYYGACLAQQWENAIAVDPQIVFVTGWNEWVAMKIDYWAAGYNNVFVDQYNDEFSRDCEPSAGKMRDYYYYQLASYIRKYKGCDTIKAASEEKLIDVNGGFGQWDNVGPVYTDYFGLPDRDFDGYKNPETNKKYHYTNTTGRNDIYDCKVARDYENLYFMVRTVNDLTDRTDDEWMHLYISVGEETSENWEHYEYVVNKTAPDSDKAYLDKFTGDGYMTKSVCKLDYKVTGNVLVICIPKTALGIAADCYDFSFDFKWTDNTGVDGNLEGSEEGEIMQWYLNGDVAPVGRFNYRYTTSAPEKYVAKPNTSGWLYMDFTSDTIKAEYEQYVKLSEAAMNSKLTDEGLELSPTSADGEYIINLANSPVAISSDVYQYVVVTYKTSDVTVMRFAPAGGVKNKKPAKNKSLEVELNADGQLNTVVLDLSQTKTTRFWSDGYANQFGFYFDSSKGGESITIASIQFLKDAPQQ
ncbi:MAG: hypothetical protein MJ192_06525 [Clostridia bacterium]|nr:hypothetical protein [Clostridia bacterium]